jgi:hypothetical protein
MSSGHTSTAMRKKGNYSPKTLSYFLLPSRLSLSVPDLHQISPFAFALGVADFHRRSGIAPCPEENMRQR